MHRRPSGTQWLPSLLLITMLGAGVLMTHGPIAAPGVVATSTKASPAAELSSTVHTHPASASGQVGAQLASHPDDVAYCVSASLEPFDGALAQLRTSGPGETAGRLQWCLMETMFGHTSQAIATELNEYGNLFSNCYRPLATSPAPAKTAAVATIAGCVGTAARTAP